MAKTPTESARKKKPASKAKATPKAKATATTGGSVSTSKLGSKSKTPRTPKKTKTKSPKSTTTPGQDHHIITSSETILHGADGHDGNNNTAATTTTTNDKGNSSKKVFYSHIQYIPRCNMFMKSDPMTPPTFLYQTSNNNDNEEVAITWRIAIGDLVCIENPSKTTDGDVTSCPPGPTKLASNAPFTVGWRHGQILSFFKERVHKKLSTKVHWGPLKMEVRWFYRHYDLDDRNRRYEKELFDAKKKKQKQKLKKEGLASSSSIKKKTKTRGRGELFETGHVAVLDASLLLGRLVLKQRGGKMSANDSPLEYPVPTVVNYCYRYYLHAEKDIVELYERENALLIRGMKCSKILQQHASARKAAYRFLFLSPPRNNDHGILDESLISIPPSIENIRYADQKVFAYYPHCTLTYPWSQVSHINLLCPRDVRDSFPKWQLCVGDIVAVPCEESTPASDADVIPGRDQWYPYLVRWSHCQIMSIFRQVENDDSKQDGTFPASSLSCEIRWFPRVAEAQKMCGQKKRVIERLKNISNDEVRTSEEILEGKQVSIIDCGSLLGPVFVDERLSTSNDDDDDKNPVSPFLIQNRRIVSNAILCNEAGVPQVTQWGFDLDPAERVHRGIDASKRFKSDKKKRDNQEAVLRSRKERAVRIGNERRAREVEGEDIFGEEDAGVEVGRVLAASFGGEGGSHGNRKLFGVDFSDEKGGSKLPRSSAHGVPFEMGNQDATMSETVDMIDCPQNNGKNEEQPIVFHKTRVSCSDPFHVDVSGLKSFYEEVDIIPPFDSYDRRFSTRGGSKLERGQWKVKLGETVAMTYEDDAEDPNADHFPFVAPWAPAEIVSIYRVHKSKESCARLGENISKGDQQEEIALQGDDIGGIMVEIRWLYRSHDVPSAFKEKAEPAESKELEEVLETDFAEVFPAETILSPIRLHDDTTALAAPSTIAGMPCIHYHCSRLWSTRRNSIFSSGTMDGRVLRGRKYSAHKAALSKLQRMSASSVKSISSAKSTSSAKKRRKQSEKAPIGTIQSVAMRDHTQKKAKTEEQPIILHKTRVSCSDPFHVDVSAMKSFYEEMCIIPPFDSYDNRFSTGKSAKMRRGQWKVKLGDTVTITYEDDAVDSSATHFPFVVRWAPAEIISIYRVHKTKGLCESLCEKLPKGDTQKGNDAGEIMVEIRWLYRRDDVSGTVKKKLNPADSNEMEEVFETDIVELVSAETILSPIRLHDVATPSTGPSTIAGMPCIHYHCSRFWSLGRRSFGPSGPVEGRVLRGRKYSAHKAALSKLQQIPPSPAKSTASAKKQRKQSEKAPIGTIQSVAISDRSRKKAKSEEQPIILHKTRVSCSDPFHVDVSAMKSFYEEVDIIPPFDSYDHRFSTRAVSKLERGQWKVKLGDTVTLEVEKTLKDSSAFHFPFLAPWAPAEIVSIYRVHKSKESCARLREELSVGNTQQGNDAGEIMVEIRWFYRSHEIPGASRKKSESVFDELEEVFETDQVDICSADSILSPIRLHDVAMPLTASSPIAGVPCIHYHCSRLWSIHRRTFVPSGSCSNRVLRGRMYSAHKAAFNKLQQMLSSSVENTDSAYQQREKPWKEAFQFAIQQLSLAEAAQDAQENGMPLPCREEERKQITSFLKKAIRGLVHSNKDGGGEEDETMNLKSSLFIAGPPGTGKTASVRSIIAELQREQHEGKLPEFNFIALNGMELRHPFDSYVKFWEAVSGTRKERLPAGDAAHELENYFCGDQGEESDGSGDDDDSDDDDDDDERSENEEESEVDLSERPVTVLMLDEIDYLVTKKETLVYNFFDWPLRATTARLVVIGISNTINLPEKMSTRVQSRIGGDRCHFKSYNVQDTQTILKSRLGMLDDHPGHAVFEEDAIKFAARKTANLSGDIRKAFQMCKSAAEKVLEDYSTGKRKLSEGSRPLVKISDVQKGSRDMFTSIVHKAVSCSTSFEALLLISLGALKRTREDGSIFVKEILTKIESIADASGEPKYMNAHLSFEDVLRMANRLGEAGIIQLNIYSSSPWPWISTHLHTSEILACYRDTNHIKLAEKHLATQRLF